MVSIQTIKRLSDEVNALQARYAPKRPWKSIVITRAVFSDPEAVEKLHFELFPEDEDPDVCIVNVYHDDYGRALGPDRKEEVAWHRLAREEQARLSRPDLYDLWARRAIAFHLKNVRAGEAHFATVAIGETVARFQFPEKQAFTLMREAGVNIEDDRVIRAFEHGKTVGSKIGVTLCLTASR